MPPLSRRSPGAPAALPLPQRRERAGQSRRISAAGWTCARASKPCRWTASGISACLPGLTAEEHRRVHYYAVLPNLLLSLHPDYMMTHTLWPRAVDRTEIVCEWHFHPDAIAGPDFSPDDAVAFWDMTNRQDWHVCEQMQLGLKSRAYRPGPYSRREDLLHALRPADPV